MSYAVVTTFSPKGYDVYGRRMIETFAAFWPAKVALHVYYEGDKPSDASDRAVWHSLDADKDRAAFMAAHEDEDPKDYRKCPVKFCHKVYAMTSAPRDTDHLMWLDSDCETTAPVKSLSECLAKEGQIGSYLARPYSRHSETGFLSFYGTGGYQFLDAFRKFYNDGEPLKQSEQHDSMAFDVLRRRFEKQGFRFRNICPDATGLTVFPQSALKGFITHNKGVARKARAYGDHMIPGETRTLEQLASVVIE